MFQMREKLEATNPEYDLCTGDWKFWFDSLTGGEHFLRQDYVIKHPRENEDPKAFEFRKQFAVYEGFAKNVLKDYVARLFGPGLDIQLYNPETTPKSQRPYLDAIQADADLLGNSLINVLRGAIFKAGGMGMSAIATDVVNGGEAVSIEQALRQGARPYIRIFEPQNILDWLFDEYGNLLWVKVRELAHLSREWDNYKPTVTPHPVFRYFIFDREKVTRFEPVDENNWREESIPHNLGVVPLERLYWELPEPGQMFQPSIVSEIFRTQFLILQAKSGISEIIENQCFSIFVIASGLGRRKDEEIRYGTKRAIRVPGGEGFPPFFASPEPELPRVHLEFIEYLEKTIKRQSKGVGISQVDDKVREASGRSKSYDVDGLTNLLRDAGDQHESSVSRILKLIHRRSVFGSSEFTGRAKFPDSHILRGVLEEAEEASAGTQVLAESPTACKIIKQKFASTTLRSTASPEDMSQIMREIKGSPVVDMALLLEPQQGDTKNVGTDGKSAPGSGATAVKSEPSRAGEQPGRSIKRVGGNTP